MKLEIPKLERVVLLGGGKLLVSVAKWCLSEGISLSVVTSPRHATETVASNLTLEAILERERIKFCIADDIQSTTARNFLSDLSRTFCLSIGAPWIFTDDVINSIFFGRLFNLHGTRLPQNRGGGGFSWQIMMGNRLGFCQLHLIDSGIDTGDIVRTREFLYPPACRKPIHYEEFSQEKDQQFVVDLLEEIRQRGVCLETVKQSEYLSTYWPRLSTAKDSWIDWGNNVNALERFICAFDEPYEGAKTLLNDEQVIIKDVCVDYSDPQFHDYQSGIVFRKNTNWISVCTIGGTLIVQSIKDQCGSDLSRRINVGDRLFTPQRFLEGRAERTVYTPKGLKE